MLDQAEKTDRREKLRAKPRKPVFEVIKHVMGFKGFPFRSTEKVTGEWDLVCPAYNAKRLHTMKMV